MIAFGSYKIPPICLDGFDRLTHLHRVMLTALVPILSLHLLCVLCDLCGEFSLKREDLACPFERVGQRVDLGGGGVDVEAGAGAGGQAQMLV
jgi:hypothetical protein